MSIWHPILGQLNEKKKKIEMKRQDNKTLKPKTRCVSLHGQNSWLSIWIFIFIYSFIKLGCAGVETWTEFSSVQEKVICLIGVLELINKNWMMSVKDIILWVWQLLGQVVSVSLFSQEVGKDKNFQSS